MRISDWSSDVCSSDLQLSKTERRIHARLKSRAKKDGIPFNLDVSDIIVPPVCPILGTPLVDRTGLKAGGTYNTPSIDRKDPTLGYVKGNIGVISRRANLLKNNITIDEVRRLDRKSTRLNTSH